jgi:hypothetical protein
MTGTSIKEEFFFEKKNQKTFVSGSGDMQRSKSFCFFLQKEALPSP